jgi:hypothetical protein
MAVSLQMGSDPRRSLGILLALGILMIELAEGAVFMYALPHHLMHAAS